MSWWWDQARPRPKPNIPYATWIAACPTCKSDAEWSTESHHLLYIRTIDCPGCGSSTWKEVHS